MADGSGRDWFILANSGGFISKYRDTGDKDKIYGDQLRNYPRIVLKNSGAASNQPILQAKQYLKKALSVSKNNSTNLSP